jgi:hypothetical protein
MTSLVFQPLRSALIDLAPHWEEAKYFMILLDADLLSESEILQIAEAIVEANTQEEQVLQLQKLYSLRQTLAWIAEQEAIERTSKQAEYLYFPV